MTHIKDVSRKDALLLIVGLVFICVLYFIVGYVSHGQTPLERHLPLVVQTEIRDAYRYAAHCGGTVSVEPLNDGTSQEDRIGKHDVVVVGCDQ